MNKIFTFCFALLCCSILSYNLNGQSGCPIQISQIKSNNTYTLSITHADSLKLKLIGWSTGQSESKIQITKNGSYCVKVQFSNGCTTDKCVTINDINTVVCGAEIASKTDGATTIFCISASSAIKRVKWSTGDTVMCIYPKTSGEYCATILTATGCEQKICKSFTAPPACKVEITKVTNANLSISLCAIASPEARKFSWSTGDTVKCITPTKSGEYCVKITTASGCEVKACINYTVPAPTCRLEISKTATENGSFKLCAVTTSDVKLLTWSTGDTGRCITVTKTGEYCSKILTTSGCDTKACVAVTITPPNNCSVNITQVADASNKISLCANASSDAKSYLWSTGETTRCMTPTKSGEYCVKITTANGCESKACINFTIQLSDATCKAEITKTAIENGGFKLCLVSSSTIKTMQWSTGDTGKCINVTRSGEYCVKIITSAGCQTSACINISIATTNCKAEIIKTVAPNGLHTLCILSSSIIKKVLWSTNDTTKCISPTKSGEYCAKITTSDGCETRVCTSITVGNGTTCKSEIVRSTTSTGATMLCASTSSVVKKYKWSTNDSTKCITPTKSGEYCVTILTADGCETKTCVVYTIPTPTPSCRLSISKSSEKEVDYLCLTLAVNADLKKISWSTGDSARCIKPTKSGIYCVKIVTKDGCENMACITYVAKPDVTPSPCMISVYREVKDSKVYLCAKVNGSADSVKWSNGKIGSCIQVTANGRYCATFTNRGCEAKACVNVENFGSLKDNGLSSDFNDMPIDQVVATRSFQGNALITSFGPNPTQSTVQIDVFAKNDHESKLTVFDMNGRAFVDRKLMLSEGENTVEVDLSTMQNGIYYVKIIGSTSSQMVKVIRN